MVIETWIATQALSAAVAMAAASLPNASEAASKPAPVDYSRRGIGFTAGATSGVGFAWRDVNRDGLGYSVGGGLWIDSFERPSARWAIGLQGIKVLHQTPWWRLYVLAGVQSYGYPTYVGISPTAPPPAPVTVKPDTPPPTAPPVTEPPRPVQQLEQIINVGGGLGLELGGPPGVTLALELPIVLGIRIDPLPGLHHLLPFPNLMLLYNF